MNWQEIEAGWAKVVPTLKTKWAKLSDEDLARPEEKRELLVSALEKHYGIQRKHAELQLDRFVEKILPSGALPPAKAPPAGQAPPAAGKGT